MIYFMLYLLTSVSKVSTLLKIGGVFFWLAIVVSVLIVIGCVVIWMESDLTLNEIKDKAMKLLYKPIKFVLIAGALSYSIGSILPTERDIAIIIGGGIAYEALTSDKGREIGGKAVDALIMKVDEILASPPTTKETIETLETIKGESL